MKSKSPRADIDSVARHRVMEYCSRFFGSESEESLPPRIIDLTEQFSPKLL